MDKKVIKGKNDLLSKRAQVAADWDYERNEKRPDEVYVFSKDEAYWVCQKCRHKWQYQIIHRSRGCKCPRCAGRVPKLGENDLASQRKELIKDWDYEVNEKKPEEVFVFSNKPAHWVCHKCGHKWEVSINHRSAGNGCPCCAGQVLVAGKNDLASQRPKLIEDWDYEANEKKPEEVFVFSNKPAHWKCRRCEHKWEAIINNRSKGNGCPCCAGQVLVVGKNDLASQRPELVKDWDYEANEKTPKEVFVFSNQYAKWCCNKCGHKWSAKIENRSNGKNCGACNSRHATEKRKLL